MWGNAFLLSLIYLAVGLVVELALTRWQTPFLRNLSLSLDSLPARALELVGAMGPLRQAYLTDQIPKYGLRIIFGLTTMAVIFLLALVVGTFMGGLRVFLMRRAYRRAGGDRHP
ncbi:hypothetical protein HPC49_39315 [Pyxidicoccus fallax]|uniref:Uncharacterized protein n=2 Tax=Pyxidicoccus fallax TaxID=394095 RepID=A0A848LXS1_9BACT|nr:hypothetical protein [Pyxidicoccus fallax]NMO22390.1 hypothetical protein [Pyxidicoccus fallax]NPC84251.1 hypothetical protein [Pyxidicoccus fallax]